MPDERTYYVISDDNCKFESMTKEQILTAIAEAIEEGEIHDVDTGFVTKIKEQNRNGALKFWIGTSAEYNALQQKDDNTFYILSDDTSFDDITSELSSLTETVAGLSSTVTDLGGTVAEHTTEIDLLNGYAEEFNDMLSMYDLMEGWTLLNQNVEYSDSVIVPFTFPHGEDLPSIDIGSWKMVKVITSDNNEVLCDVFEHNNFYYIRGTSCGSSSQSSHITLISINITCESDHTYANNSTSTLISSNGAISISQQAIKKIIGIGTM